MVEFRILGSLGVSDGPRSIEPRRAKPRAVLAVLLLHANQVVSTDRLIEALWGDSPPPSAANTLQGYVSHLRHLLAPSRGLQDEDPVIDTRAPGYVLIVDPMCIDARRFEDLVAQGRLALAGSDARRAAATLGEALALWQGPALADFAYQRFATVEAARLEDLRLGALEDQAEAELALGQHTRLVGRLQALVEEHPLRERLWGLLMVALYRCGRQGESLRAFQVARRTLAEELGIDPGPALRTLEADILAQAPSLDREEPTATGRARGSEVPFPGLLSLGPSFEYVGRRALLEQLREIRRTAMAGRCQAVLLAGEPGVGKTRTAAEVALAAFADGALVLYGRCDEGFAVPYQPFAEALDWYTTHAVDPVLGRHPAELTRLQPLLASRVGGLGRPVASDPRSEEYLLFQAASSWLVDLARRRPLVLVLDDLHWASKPVLLLLRHLLRVAAEEGQLQSVPLLVVGSYRDTEVDRGHPLAGLVVDLRRLGCVDRLAVAGLSLAEVTDLLSRRAVGDEGADGTRLLAEIVHAETEGNPFFVEEVLRHLMETGAVRLSEERWVVVDRSALGVPEGVRDVVGRRIGRLTTPARELLSLASILGPHFDIELLASVRDVPEGDLLDALDEAVAARLIEETGADRYRFAHALVRATLSDELSATRLRRLHRRVAETIEKLRPDDVVALAHHYAGAGPEADLVSRAVRYGLAAAEQALGARALADAEARFRGVVGLLSDPAGADAPERVAALCGLGEAQRDQGDPQFRATLLDAGRRAHRAGEVALLVRAALSNSRGVPSVIGGVDPERVASTEAALDLVGPQPSADRARLLAQLAAEISFTGDDRRRLALSDEAEDMARTLGDDTVVAWVLNRTGYAAFSPRRVARLVARGHEAVGLSDAHGDPSQRVLSRYFLSAALLTAGDLPSFRRVTGEMLDVAEEAAPTLSWLALATQARVSMLAGDSAGARHIIDRAFALAEDLGEPDGPAWWTAAGCVHTWYRGEFADVADSLRAGIEVYPDEPAWSLGCAMSLATGGRWAEARDALRVSRPDPDALVDHVFPFLNTFMCAVVAFHLDEVELAGRCAVALGPYRSCWAHHYAGALGPVRLGLALCAAVAGEHDEAVALCEETDRVLIDLDGHGVRPLFHLYFAEVLIRRGTTRDRALAGDLLAQVRRDATERAEPSLVARAATIAARL
ncbi:MAG: BTAD domain-containing putative transcriptional regulator [Acidimicrobiales bacterium]